MAFINLLDSQNQKYDNTTSGLSAVNVQTAIDELTVSSTGTLAISDTINTNTITDVFIYDTTKDDDGGAWVDKATTQSWYSANGKFPKIAIIVIESGTPDKIIIYDATAYSVPEWDSYQNGVNFKFHGTNDFTGIAAKNGVIYIGRVSSYRLHAIYLKEDYASFRDNGGENRFLGTIAQLNTAASNWGAKTGDGIVNNVINDVAVTSDGKGNNIVAASTDAGLAIVRSDSTVVTLDDVSGDDINEVTFNSSNAVIYANETQGSLDIFRSYPATSSDPDVTYDNASTPALLANPTTTKNGLVTCPGEQICIGCATGLTILRENIATQANGMVAYITDVYSSGWLFGDIQRAYLSNSKTADRSVKAATLVEAGTVTAAVVETSAELYGYSGFSASNYFSEAYSADLDPGTGAFQILFWLKESANSATEIVLDRDSTSTAQRYTIEINASGNILFTCDDNTTTRTATSTMTIDDSQWHCFLAQYDGKGGVYIYMDGSETAIASSTGTALLTLNNATAVLRIGYAAAGASPLSNGTVSQVRTSMGNMDMQQFKHAFETETLLFQENAKCLLQHSDDDIQALAYSEEDNILTVCDTVGITRFDDLKVYDSEVDVVTAVSRGRNGMEVVN